MKKTTNTPRLPRNVPRLKRPTRKLPEAPMLYRWDNGQNDLPSRTAESPRHPERDESQHSERPQGLDASDKFSNGNPADMGLPMPPRRPRRCQSPPRNPMNVDIQNIKLTPVRLVQFSDRARESQSLCNSSISYPSSSSDADYSDSDSEDSDLGSILSLEDDDDDDDSVTSLVEEVTEGILAKAAGTRPSVPVVSAVPTSNTPFGIDSVPTTVGEVVTVSQDNMLCENQNDDCEVTLLFAVRRSGCGNCREQAVALGKLTKKLPFNVSLKGVIKPEPVRKELLEEFCSYFPFDLYEDKDWKLFHALGNRKLSLWKLLSKGPGLEVRYAKNGIVNRPLGGKFIRCRCHCSTMPVKIMIVTYACYCYSLVHTPGDLFTHGGILIFDKKGRVRFVYYEKFGAELDMEALEWAVHEARKPLPGDEEENLPRQRQASARKPATSVLKKGNTSSCSIDTPMTTLCEMEDAISAADELAETLITSAPRPPPGGACRMEPRGRRTTSSPWGAAEPPRRPNRTKSGANDRMLSPPRRTTDSKDQSSPTIPLRQTSKMGTRLGRLTASPRLPTRLRR